MLPLLSLLQVTHVRMASCLPWCVPPCLLSRLHWEWSSFSRFHWIRPQRCASSRDSARWVSRASRDPDDPRLRSSWWMSVFGSGTYVFSYVLAYISRRNIHLHLKLLSRTRSCRQWDAFSFKAARSDLPRPHSVECFFPHIALSHRRPWHIDAFRCLMRAGTCCRHLT